MTLRGRSARIALWLLVALCCASPLQDAFAQARNPFSVGISEGGGSASGVTGWILAQQQHFDLMMRAAVGAIRADPSGLWSLLGLAFLYGIFHAAGPGHGKAVLAAYLVANERALKRGLVMAALAALLQAFVAIAIVCGLAVLIGATAQAMRSAAQWVEIASYAAIALVGLLLVWRKGAAFLRERRTPTKPESRFSRFECVAGDDSRHAHGPNCGHVHMPDPTLLGGKSFAWRDALGTVVAAGLRPCSGAILVLVFAAAQGILYAGVAATLAMAVGTAVTTGTLAWVAVHAKNIAQRITSSRGASGMLALRGLELAAAVAVLLLGVGLLSGTLAGAS
ncbi:MAG: high frequency lysogenization protein HflD [Hyphomicrobiales bacterium]|nr:high frequency lysogenization protein HflD [Hyphomicrobiales bacterium]